MTTAVTTPRTTDMMPQPPATIVREGWLQKRGKINFPYLTEMQYIIITFFFIQVLFDNL